jgi:hypothetical protein
MYNCYILCYNIIEAEVLSKNRYPAGTLLGIKRRFSREACRKLFKLICYKDISVGTVKVKQTVLTRCKIKEE